MVSTTYTGGSTMSLLQVIRSWARETLHLVPPRFDATPVDPVAEVEARIERGKRVNKALLDESQYHEKADVANALLRARERATVP